MPNLLDLPRPFFPNPVVAWVSVGLLLTACGIAAYTDTKRAKVPNPLVVTTLIVGLLMNVLRGAWQVAVGHPTWLFGNTDSVWLGGLDGFLFGLIGFLVAFGAMFLLWIFGLVGGGDVKLFAAVGGWLGWLHILLAWMLSVAVLIVWTLGKVIANGLRPRQVQSAIKKLQKAQGAGREQAVGGSKKMRVTYSLPIAVAVLILSLLSHRVELKLAPPKAVPTPETSGANANDPPSPTQPK